MRKILSQRNYWNRAAESFEKIYSHKNSRFSHFLDKVFRKDMFERFVFTIQHCEPIEKRIFLDVGCGSGQYSIELAKRGAAKVIGIDIAENMLQLSRQFAAREKVRNQCTFLHTDLIAYNPDSVFDITLGIGLFDYIHNPLPVLNKMNEVTKGKIIVSFPRFWTWRAPIRKVRLLLKGCSVHFYTKSKIAELMKAAGFESYIVNKVGKLYCVIGFLNKDIQT